MFKIVLPACHTVRARWLMVAFMLSTAAAAEVSDSGRSSPIPIPVTTAKLADVVFFPVRTAPATVVSLNDARVSAQISGLLNEIMVKVGETVAKGATVARIDCRDAEADVSQSTAAYDASQAKNQYDQSQLAAARKLSASKSISGDEIDKRRANALISSAEVDKAKANLAKVRLAASRCDLKAPFNAVVIARLASVGDYVSRGTPVLQLLDTDSTEVSARIQEMDLDSLEAAAESLFHSQNEIYRVKLRTIVPMMESRLRSYEARFTFAEHKSAPGSAGRLKWASPQPHVPAEFLVRRGKLGIFVERDGLAEFIELPGAHDGQPAPFSAELAQNVIVEGRFNLEDGDAVQVNDR